MDPIFNGSGMEYFCFNSAVTEKTFDCLGMKISVPVPSVLLSSV
jgi:hypothetical protein